MDGYLDDVDWASLIYARGSARDAPRHLRALLGSDEWASVEGYSYLWSTVRSEGKAWSATAPTALAVAMFLLDDPRLGPDDPSLRDAMLAYLQTIAVAADLGGREAAIRIDVGQRAADLAAWARRYLTTEPADRAGLWTDGTGLGDLVLDQASFACFEAVPVILPRVLSHLGSVRSKRRVHAAAAVGELARHPSAAPQRPALVCDLVSMAASADNSYDLASILIAIGRLDGDTRAWLGDPRPGVRGCAALAPALAADERATEVLIEMSRSPEAFTRSFGDSAPPHHFMIPPYRTARHVFTVALRSRARSPSNTGSP